MSETKWWGWGKMDKRFELKSHPNFESYLKRHFHLPEQPVLPVPSPEDFSIPECRLSQEETRQLREIMGEGLTSSRIERLIHSVGKSYHDLIRLRRREGISFPDAVLYPDAEKQIEAVLKWAAEHHVAVVPFGGGTSVVGGVEASTPGTHHALVTMDLRKFDKIVELDSQSLIVEAEAGIRGPELEQYLHPRGFTMGHSPESFEYSSLGGWIAARSSGQFSTRYGNMEDMLESVRAVTPRGVIETNRVPAAATGPALKQIVLGSEGTFGVITRARVRITSLPPKKRWRAYMLLNFEQGIQLARKLMTTGGNPALFRLADGTETDWAMAMARLPGGKSGAVLFNLAKKWLEKRGFAPKQKSLLLLGWEGETQEMRLEQKHFRRILRGFKSVALGKLPVQIWYRNRYDNPYMRDTLLDYGLLIDTLETAGEWRLVPGIYEAVRQAISDAFANLGISGVVGAHLSHLYPQGSSLYFIILAQPRLGREVEEWRQIKKAASDAILRAGGTISHHHGIGLDHREWYGREIGPTWAGMMQNLKRYLDPENVLNPGKLIP